MNPPISLQAHLDFAISVAKNAGEIMTSYFGRDPLSELKEDDTIVTIADKEINQMVIDRVNKSFPDHSVEGEEASEAKGGKHVWVCDPIDGTCPFSCSLAISVFSLAYVYDGEPLVGVVYDPFAKRMYSAIKGEGAFVNGKKMCVSQVGFGKEARLSYDQWARADFDVLTPLAKLAQETGTYMLSPGSTTHMAMMVAQGDFVASIFPGTAGKNVDIAAAKVIVEEAGGKVTDLFGQEQRYDQDIQGAIVSNGAVHDEIVKVLRGSR